MRTILRKEIEEVGAPVTVLLGRRRVSCQRHRLRPGERWGNRWPGLGRRSTFSGTVTRSAASRTTNPLSNIKRLRRIGLEWVLGREFDFGGMKLPEVGVRGGYNEFLRVY
jgi:hypothetical protein